MIDSNIASKLETTAGTDLVVFLPSIFYFSIFLLLLHRLRCCCGCCCRCCCCCCCCCCWWWFLWMMTNASLRGISSSHASPCYRQLKTVTANHEPFRVAGKAAAAAAGVIVGSVFCSPFFLFPPVSVSFCVWHFGHIAWLGDRLPRRIASAIHFKRLFIFQKKTFGKKRNTPFVGYWMNDSLGFWWLATI